MAYELTPIEAIIRHRELHGYGLIEELREIFRRATESERCFRVVVKDAPFVSQFPPAIEFLKENGFHLVHLEGEQQGPQEPIVVLQLGKSDTSPLLSLDVRREMVAARSLLQWAAACNSALLVVTVADILMREPLSKGSSRSSGGEFRFQLLVEWRDEVGKERKQEMESAYYSADDGVLQTDFLTMSSFSAEGSHVASEHASPFLMMREASFEASPHFSAQNQPSCSVQQQQQGEREQGVAARGDSVERNGGEFNGRTPTSVPVGAVAPMWHYRNARETFSTACDQACTVTVLLFRKRRFVTDKLVAFTTYTYRNVAMVHRLLELKDPDAPNGLPLGRVAIVIESLMHRCFKVESELRKAHCTPKKRAAPRPANSDSQEDASGAGQQHRAVQSQVSTRAAWCEQLAKPPNDDGRHYDEDDYFGS